MNDNYEIQERLSSLIKKMTIVVSCLFILFSILAVYESAVIEGWSEEKKQFKKDTQTEYMMKNCYEGAIIDCNGLNITTQAESKGVMAPIEEGYAFSFGWIIGTRNSNMSLRDGIRQVYGYELFDQSFKDKGATIQLTIDREMQRSAYIALDAISDDGSIIVLDNQSGAIKAFATRGFVPYNGNDQSAFSTESQSVATSQYMRGIYEQDPPASTFKLVTLACAIENGVDFTASEYASFYDDGTYEYDGGSPLKNFQNKVFGTINVQQALNNSVNTYFGFLADQLGEDKLAAMYDKCLIGEDITIDFRSENSNTLKSQYNLKENSASVSHTGIGQGQTQITPLHLASIISAFANEGEMMQPYMVQKIDGKNDYSAKVSTLSQICSKETCDELNNYAHQTALSYGFSEQECGWVCAKSGTAEFEGDKMHSYFVAYNQNYTILISCNDVATSNQLVSTMKQLLMEFKVS